MTSQPTQWLGLDIGGANLKAAHSSGQARSVPFELWKRPSELPEAIRHLVATMPKFDAIALTMTAELCDCYETKAEGVQSVLDAVPKRQAHVWGVDGRFYTLEAARMIPLVVSASNWMALASVVARLGEIRMPALLIDIGSTTTDLIPLDRRQVFAQGRTDTQRLQTGELVYAGVKRTPLCALDTQLPLRGVSTGLAAELFATTLDVYLTLGEIPEAPHDHTTADGRSMTINRARDRLARMVGADREGFSKQDAFDFSQEADQCLVTRLEKAARKTCTATIGEPKTVIVAGSGEFLARRVALRLVHENDMFSLASLWGSAASDAACAHAVVQLAQDLIG